MIQSVCVCSMQWVRIGMYSKDKTGKGTFQTAFERAKDFCTAPESNLQNKSPQIFKTKIKKKRKKSQLACYAGR